ncbi:MAG: DUF4139 domain-containing protein [Phycisphaerales bacterium]|nr:DUF4139 domain-containing protein [Phycisphaerales bacterium]
MTTILASSFLASSLATPTIGQETSLTVYSDADPASFDPLQFVDRQRNHGQPVFAFDVPGFGVVKQVREIEMKAGRNEIAFSNVAQFLDPTTVSFTDLTDPRTRVLEQTFKFDLVSPSKLMERYLDKNVNVVVPDGEGTRAISGVLLSSSQGRMVLKTDQGIEILPAADARVRLDDLPGGFLTKPTLLWLLDAKRDGKHSIRTTYQTGGLSWRADYNLVLNADDTAADLNAWVTLLNLSGMSFPDTNLKLVAGDVQRVQPRRPVKMVERMYAEDTLGAGAGFEEKAFFEYHLYTLPRKTTIDSNSTQQLTLFPATNGMKIEKELVYEPSRSIGWGRQPHMDPNFIVGGEAKIGVFIAFENTKDNRLGVPLPAGKIRTYKEDPADGTLEFIGEDLIDHTPRNETVRIKLGNAFDVVGERTRTNFTIEKGRKTMTESFKIEIRNQKDKAQSVTVREHLYRWNTWNITERNLPFKKINSNTVEWSVDVPPEGSKTITYTVVYTW